MITSEITGEKAKDEINFHFPRRWSAELLLYIFELIFTATFVRSLAYRKTNIIEISDYDSESYILHVPWFFIFFRFVIGK